MESYIDLTERQYEAIWEHLLPDGATCESAAFIFASVQDVNQSLVLRAQDYFLVGQGGFNAQSNNYIELSDESRINVIKKAHQTHTALVELHSHPFNSHRSAAFSLADMNGFMKPSHICGGDCPEDRMQQLWFHHVVLTHWFGRKVLSYQNVLQHCVWDAIC